MMIDATIIAVRAYVLAGGSKQALADASGVHRNTLLGMESPGWEPTIRTVKRLRLGLKALGNVELDKPILD